MQEYTCRHKKIIYFTNYPSLECTEKLYLITFYIKTDHQTSCYRQNRYFLNIFLSHFFTLKLIKVTITSVYRTNTKMSSSKVYIIPMVIIHCRSLTTVLGFPKVWEHQQEKTTLDQQLSTRWVSSPEPCLPPDS